MSKLRVIIPCAPHDVSFLRSCLESVTMSLNDLFLRKSKIISEAVVQVVFDGEIGSPEKTFEGLTAATPETSYQWKMLKPARGAAVARNYALGWAAPDDFVVFMDADDVVFPWCFWTRLNAYAQADMDGVKEPFVYTQCMYIFQEPTTHKILKTVREVVLAQNVRGWLEQQNVILTTSILCRAGLLQEAGGFEPYMICGEDGCLWRRVVGLRGPATPVPIPLVTHSYKQRPESQCRRLYKAHQHMFHLEIPKHGPMGQALDETATLRGLAAKDAQDDISRVAALAGDISTIHPTPSITS